MNEETYNNMKKYIGIITDEYDNDSIGYDISTDIDDMLRWKKEMDTSISKRNDIKKCMIYEIKPYYTIPKYGNN